MYILECRQNLKSSRTKIGGNILHVALDYYGAKTSAAIVVVLLSMASGLAAGNSK